MSVLTFRADPAVDRAIDYLTATSGELRSQVIRDAILHAERDTRRAMMEREARALRADILDQTESRALLEFMGDDDAR